ncbi:MAG TPA: MFS transporter, partial [Stenotrophomonas sp.]
VSEGLVGQGIAISGAFAVLTSLCISRLAGNADRKLLLLGLTALMAVSGSVVALAPNYPVYLIGRALIGIVVGGFWSMSAATAMRLVPPALVPRALAIFNGGNALATVIAAPLGSYLGAIMGWRSAFFCLVPIALVALVWQWRSLPSMKAGQRIAAGGVFRLLRSRIVLLGMLACAAFFMGQFALFTYIRPFLETVTRLEVSALSWVLLGIGFSGVIGTAVVGSILKHGLYRVLVIIPLLMAAIAMGLTLFGSSAGAVALLLALWGLFATAAPVGWWSWIAQTLPADAEAGGGLMVAVIQLAIALGSTFGGLLFDYSGYRSSFVMSAGVLVSAAVLAMLTARAPPEQAA